MYFFRQSAQSFNLFHTVVSPGVSNCCLKIVPHQIQTTTPTQSLSSNVSRDPDPPHCVGDPHHSLSEGLDSPKPPKPPTISLSNPGDLPLHATLLPTQATIFPHSGLPHSPALKPLYYFFFSHNTGACAFLPIQALHTHTHTQISRDWSHPHF